MALMNQSKTFCPALYHWVSCGKFNSHLQNFFLICFNDSSSKMIKNAFYFILKALFFLKIFKFLSWIFGHVEKRAWLEDKVNFKIYDVTAWLQTIAIHILPDTSRSKSNQTMKLGQLIQYNKRKIFLQKLCRKRGRETRSRLLFNF